MATTKKDDRVEVYVPRGNAGDEPNLFVSVNGKSFLLPRGKKSMVPQHIADEINRSHNAVDVMDEHAAAMTSAQ